MNLRSLIIVVTMAFSFITVADEPSLLKPAKAAVKEKQPLSEEEQRQREKALIRVLMLPCEPYPLCT
jgi:hypothetical protein